MRNSIRLLTWLYAIFVFMSMQPYFVWGSEILFVIIFIFIFLLCFFNRLDLYFDKKILVVNFSALLFFLYLSLPFREFDGGVSYRHILYFIAILLYLLFLKKYTFEIWSKLRLIFGTLCFFVFISYVFHMLNVPFPKIELSQNFRLKGTDTYYYYYGMIILNTQQYSIAGIDLLRNVGWFGEPGHFGIYLAMLLSLEEKPLKGKINHLIILCMLTTLSAAAFLFLFLILVIKYLEIKKIITLMAIILTVCIISYMNMDLINHLFISKISTNSLEERSYFHNDFYIRTLWVDIFGLGKDVLKINNIVSSDYRAMWLRYGLVSFIIYFFVLVYTFLLVDSREKLRQVIVFLLIALAIFLHRVWMVDTLYFWVYIFVVVSYIRLKN